MFINHLKTKDHSVLFTRDKNNREICVYKFMDVNCVGINLYYPNVLLQSDKKLYLPILEKTMSLKSGTIYEKEGMYYTPTLNDVKIVTNNPVFFFVYNTDNYYHFLYDTLPYLISFFQLRKVIPELKLLMQYPNEQKQCMYKFVLEFLELLDITMDDILLINNETRYSTVYVSTSYTHDFDSNLPPREEIFSFYQSIVNKAVCKCSNIILHDKIYISRRTWKNTDNSNIGTNYTLRRLLINESELVDVLITHGFVEIFTEQLSTIEKIKLFANAKIVIGAIGGGISNVVFSNKNTKLIALVSPTFLDVNFRFTFCLNCVNVSYYMQTSHVETDVYKKYMRVKIPKLQIVGEIINVNSDNVEISYTTSNITGWNAENSFNKITVPKTDIEILDSGLNSAWKINNVKDINLMFK